jgi:cysteine-rich repeat protein
MRVLPLLLVLLVACDGTDPEVDGGMEGDAGDPCAGQSDGTACGEDICVGGACVESSCGDGYVDEAAGEQCEDENTTAFDGCEPGTCTFTCNDDASCDDLEPCNGTETCDDQHVCVSGTAPADRTACGDARVCLDEECVPAGCGNGGLETDEECDDGRNGDDLDGCTDTCEFQCTLWDGTTNVIGGVIGGFEAGSSYSIFDPSGAGPSPIDSGVWFGDRATLVMADRGIAPLEGARMLRFDATGTGGASADDRAQAKNALVIPSPFAERVSSGLLRAHLSAHVDRTSAVGSDTELEVSIYAYDAHPDDGGVVLGSTTETIAADALLDTWECAHSSFRVPVGTTVLVAEIAAIEDVENDTTSPELDGHYTDEVALWFSEDACVEGDTCVPPGDLCAIGTRSCATDTCVPTGPGPDGAVCDVQFQCASGFCSPNVRVTSAVDLTTDRMSPDRSCAEAPAYSVVSIAGSAITLATAPIDDCLAAGDEVLLINLQGSATSVANVGRWELLRVDTVSATDVTLASAPVAHYGASPGADDEIGIGEGQQRVALVRVPSYGDMTIASSGSIRAAGWDGLLGGVIALRAAHLTVEGAIDAEGLGYRSGDWSIDDSSCADNLLTGGGESIGGNPGPSALASFGGSGGIEAFIGQSFASNPPLPGAAGHSSAGEPGENARARTIGPAGAVYGAGDGSLLTMGSGPGGAMTCEPRSTGGPRYETRGTQAGGIILLLSDTLTVSATGRITANADQDSDLAASGGYVLVRGSDLTVGAARITARGEIGRRNTFTNQASAGYIVLDATDVDGTTDPAFSMP